MTIIHTIADIALHINSFLEVFVQQYGTLTYIILFAVIFCETGFVVTPFLPGDSLLFAVGALAASLHTSSTLDPLALFVVLSSAAILGDIANYAIGHAIGAKLLERNIPLLKQEHIRRAYVFYERDSGTMLILARFVPIMRTFAPFVAGISKMNYRRFIKFNVIGGLVWVGLFISLGYLFGAVPFVKQHFELVVLGIGFVSVLPMVAEYLKHRQQRAIRSETAVVSTN
jgi:membrane-associated protein